MIKTTTKKLVQSATAAALLLGANGCMVERQDVRPVPIYNSNGPVQYSPAPVYVPTPVVRTKVFVPFPFVYVPEFFVPEFFFQIRGHLRR